MLFSINFNFVDVGLIRKFSTIACEQLNFKRRIFSTKCTVLLKQIAEYSDNHRTSRLLDHYLSMFFKRAC